MISLLPASLLGAIAALGAGSAGLGFYLELTDATWLSAHPFTTNLISSVVGFCTVTLVAGVGFTVLTERAQREKEWRIARGDTEVLAESARLLANRVAYPDAVDKIERIPTPESIRAAVRALHRNDDAAVAGIGTILASTVAFHGDVVDPYLYKYVLRDRAPVKPSHIAAMADSLREARRLCDAGEDPGKVAGLLGDYYDRLASLIAVSGTR